MGQLAVGLSRFVPLTKVSKYVNLNHGTALAFYRTEKGQCPVEEFLDSLPSKVAQKVTWVLKLI